MEASETPTRAETTANYFATLPDGRQVSAHYCADSDSVVQCVRLSDTAWAVGNSQGNQRGISWEFSGFASQTSAQWKDAFDLAMFAKAVPIMARDMRRFGIPPTWLTDDQVKAFKPGLTTHNQLRRCFGGTTHTDPGPAFPFDYIATLLAGELFLINYEQYDRDRVVATWDLAQRILTAVQALAPGGVGTPDDRVRAIVREELDKTKLLAV
jgi:N-acetyl-anhydromuramyl-L-alanine amidase AmpD